MSEIRRYRVLKIRRANADNPSVYAETTPEIDRLIKQKSDKIPLERIRFAGIVGNIPVSEHSNVSRKKFLETMRTNLDWVKEREAKIIPKNVELQIDLMFFITEDYDRRDLGRLIPPLLDSLQGYIYESDSQIKRIIAEKHLITDVDSSIDKKFYEQICFVVSIPDL